MADELTRVDQWIYQTLTADSALTAIVGTKVFVDNAPQGTAFPFVVFSLEYATDVVTHSHTRIMVDSVWRIRVNKASESYDSEMRSAADRIDVLFDRTSGSAGEAQIFSSVREEPYKRPLIDDGKQYRALGGIYRVLAQIP
ncbi:MAG: DUF3168 domain-containing protein [Acidimicrobiia bacterium]